MRILAVIPLLLVAACGGTAEGEPKDKAKLAVAKQLEPGQWETIAEVTQLSQMDEGKPAIATPAGTRTTANACIGEADVRKPAPVLFTTAKDDACDYKDMYMSNGRFNGSIACTRKGLSGEVLTRVEGKFTGDSFEGTTVARTYLASEGDVKISSKLTARRLGACTA
jgi:hypothetical protein